MGGHFAWSYIDTDDYIIAYHLTTWVQQIKWEASVQHATSYRLKRMGFSTDKITCGKWTTKNDEEVFVLNPKSYFDNCIGIGYGNLMWLTRY